MLLLKIYKDGPNFTVFKRKVKISLSVKLQVVLDNSFSETS